MEAALEGYREVIDHWAAGGNWSHQWVTLRNLADLLRPSTTRPRRTSSRPRPTGLPTPTPGRGTGVSAPGAGAGP